MATQLELIGQVGYAALSPETTIGTAVTPGVFVPYASEKMETNWNLDKDTTAAGLYWKNYQSLPGQRDHTGSLEVLAEPNTAAEWLNILMTLGSKTGSNPYTWPGTWTTTRPASATLDIALGTQQVKRFFGLGASKLGIKFDKNTMHFNLDLSALGSFHIRTLASTPTGSGPYTVVLDTTYSANPTNGLVTGDLITFQNAAGTTTTTATVAGITNGTTLTTSTNVTSFVQGDSLFLRPQTPTYPALVNSPFQWAKTQFCFGATASAALTATQTRVEQGSEYEISHPFSDSKGEPRSGDYDPASLIYLAPETTLKIKKFFSSEADLVAWTNITQQALVIRHYAGATNQYEFRVTFNNIKTAKYSILSEADKVIYAEIEYNTDWNSSDGQANDIKVINSLSAL